MFADNEFEDLTFKKSLRKYPFGLDAGTEEKPEYEAYVLCEMTSKERDNFLDFMGKKMPGGRIKEVEGLQAELLTRCIKAVKLDKDSREVLTVAEKKDISELKLDELFLAPVSKTDLQSWGCNMQTDLFEKASKLNGLWDEEGKAAAAQAKNS